MKKAEGKHNKKKKKTRKKKEDETTQKACVEAPDWIFAYVRCLQAWIDSKLAQIPTTNSVAIYHCRLSGLHVLTLANIATRILLAYLSVPAKMRVDPAVILWPRMFLSFTQPVWIYLEEAESAAAFNDVFPPLPLPRSGLGSQATSPFSNILPIADSRASAQLVSSSFLGS
ncbi:uncharacterized protein MEPE_02004 [Melanopsichium pennsylvanicum]|uniref:Uncharacterized protein n=1 Tax=Melanopsichium pennsylvanicum TaxID=63383 RepID=A0AAJ5C461_9BASI|nr:uncharacterized protein MEPE_02004 [Melanopsichium pennsylvanicum]